MLPFERQHWLLLSSHYSNVENLIWFRFVLRFKEGKKKWPDRNVRSRFLFWFSNETRARFYAHIQEETVAPHRFIRMEKPKNRGIKQETNRKLSNSERHIDLFLVFDWIFQWVQSFLFWIAFHLMSYWLEDDNTGFFFNGKLELKWWKYSPSLFRYLIILNGFLKILKLNYFRSNHFVSI